MEPKLSSSSTSSSSKAPAAETGKGCGKFLGKVPATPVTPAEGEGSLLLPATVPAGPPPPTPGIGVPAVPPAATPVLGRREGITTLLTFRLRTTPILSTRIRGSGTSCPLDAPNVSWRMARGRTQSCWKKERPMKLQINSTSSLATWAQIRRSKLWSMLVTLQKS